LAIHFWWGSNVELLSLASKGEFWPTNQRSFRTSGYGISSFLEPISEPRTLAELGLDKKRAARDLSGRGVRLAG